jgi:hypothetical protein
MFDVPPERKKPAADPMAAEARAAIKSMKECAVALKKEGRAMFATEVEGWADLATRMGRSLWP